MESGKKDLFRMLTLKPQDLFSLAKNIKRMSSISAKDRNKKIKEGYQKLPYKVQDIKRLYFELNQDRDFLKSSYTSGISELVFIAAFYESMLRRDGDIL